MRVLAIDPGIDTGWAEGRIEDKQVHVDRHGWTPWRKFALSLDSKVDDFPYDVIVYETWKLTKHGAKVLLGSDMQSSQCVGCIWLSGTKAHVPIVGQPPAIKATIDKWMGGTGYLPVSDVDHNRDAIRHLYYYAMKPANEHGVPIPTTLKEIPPDAD